MQNRKTFFVSFFLRRDRVMKNGTAPIMARISVNGIAREVYTQCRTPVDKWDTAKGRATGRDKLAYEVNAYIDDFRAKVVEIYRTLQAEGFEGNALEIKERLQSPGKQAKMFLEELTLYCEKRQKEVGVRITQLTSNKYYRLCRYLREYTKQECKKDDIRLSAVSYGYLDGFNTYLQTAHRCHHNGAVNILDCLRNFMLYCLRNEWVEKNPFKNYKLKEVAPPPKEHLSKKEIELLMEKPMPNLRLENVRDIFVFCCLTGLAFADADQLRREHLSQDDEGRWWIHKPREKTSVMSRISKSRCATALSRSATSAAGRCSPQERSRTSRFRARDRACSMSNGAHCSDATRRCTLPTKRAYEAFKRSESQCPESLSSDVHNSFIKWLFSRKRRFFDGFFLFL